MKTIINICFVLLINLLFCIASPQADTKQDIAIDAYKSGDFSNAIDMWKYRAASGDSISQFNLGLIYERGEGVEINLDLAMKFYSKAANSGFAPAQFNLAVMLSERNFIKSLGWFEIVSERAKEPLKSMAKAGAQRLRNNLSDEDALIARDRSTKWLNINTLNSDVSLYQSLPLVTLTEFQVKLLQKALSQFGLYTGKIDGVIGNLTRSALSSWRLMQGLDKGLQLVPKKLIMIN